MDVPYYLSKYDPAPLRFYLTATAPEMRDTEACPACPERSRGEGLEGFSWENFVERNNPCPERSRRDVPSRSPGLVKGQAEETNWSPPLG